MPEEFEYKTEEITELCKGFQARVQGCLGRMGLDLGGDRIPSVGRKSTLEKYTRALA